MNNMIECTHCLRSCRSALFAIESVCVSLNVQCSAVSLVFGALSSVWAGTISVLLAKVERAWAWWTWLHIIMGGTVSPVHCASQGCALFEAARFHC